MKNTTISQHLPKIIFLLLVGGLAAILFWLNSGTTIYLVNDNRTYAEKDPESGEYSGFEIDLIRAVIERLNRGKKIWFTDFERDLDRMKEDLDLCRGEFSASRVLVKGGDAPSAGRYSEGFLSAGPVLVARIDEGRFQEVQEAAAFRICNTPDYYGHTEATIWDLYQRDCDGIWMEKQAANQAIRIYPDRFKIIGESEDPLEHVLLLCDDSELESEVNQALAELKAEGVIDELVQRWFPAAQPAEVAPAPSLAPVAAWDDLIPQTVCLEEHYYNTSPDVDDFQEVTRLSTLLQRMGLEIVEPGQPCDFSLKADYQFSPTCPTYTGEGLSMRCCTGAKVEGIFSIQSGDFYRDYPFENSLKPAQQLPNTCDYDPLNAPFVSTGYFYRMITALGDLLGERVYYAALYRSNTGHPEYQAALDYFSNLPEKEAVPILVGYLKADIPNVRGNAYLLLLHLGGRYDSSLEYGSDMAEDPQLWEAWWESKWSQ